MPEILSLNGSWNLVFHDGERGSKLEHTRSHFGGRPALAACVPGDVHLDLMRAGILKEPSEGLNSLDARWVEDAVWTYQREFEWEGGGCAVWLEFERIAGCAEIFLNGRSLGRHANDFLPARFEVSAALRRGTNLLSVAVESGMLAHADDPGHPYAHGFAAAATKRMWNRKPQCQYGWDWALRLINVGLAGDVRLISTGQPVRIAQIAPEVSVRADLAEATVRVRAWIDNAGPDARIVKMQAALPALGVSGSGTAEVSPGTGLVEVTLSVPNPPLWWPRGHGPAHLETLRVDLQTDQGPFGGETLELGFRTVRVNQSPLASGGYSFIVEVNGRPVFCRGGNYVPPDLLACRVDRDRVRVLMERAEELNFNFLRVWGGGFYESEDFYQEANRRGFLVWQDMIYACSRYPLQEHGFFQNAVTEARWQMRRLARHPGLVVVCGNNEIETAQWNWGWESHGMQAPDHAFFHITLARIAQEENGAVFYWPSSPHSAYDRENGRLPNPNDDDTGDQHPWSLGFFDTDFRKYREMICRFPNEGGVLGPPALPTLLACLPEGQRERRSFAWTHHENSVAYWSEPNAVDCQITQWTGVNADALTLEDYVFWGGLVQGEGLREYCENFRRRMFESAAAVFWMFNDTWPTVRSWTPVDYYLRRTPCFHAVRRALRPVTIVLSEQKGEIRIHGVNDTPEPVEGTLTWGVLAFAGDYPHQSQARVALPANASTVLATMPSDRVTDDTRQLAFGILEGAGVPAARARLVRELPASWQLPQPEIHIEWDGANAVFCSPHFVWGICLDLDGELPLADNFFDLFPGRPFSIPWPHPNAPKIIRCGNAG